MILLACFFSLFPPAPSYGIHFEYPCSIYQGFNVFPDDHGYFGYITSFSITGRQFRADIPVVNPENRNERMNVCAVISHCVWNGGFKDPLNFSFQVSAANKQELFKISQSIRSSAPGRPGGSNVVMSFCVYDLDERQHKFFKAFYSTLQGNIRRTSYDIALYVGMEPSFEVISFKNYAAGITLEPAPCIQQLIYIGVDYSNFFHLFWGNACYDPNRESIPKKMQK